MMLSLALSLLSSARAECPAAYSSYDCVDDHSDPICVDTGWIYTCSAALGSSANSTRLHATTDSSDGTYNVYGTDSDDSEFCCSVDADDVDTLEFWGGAGDDWIDENYTGEESLCGIGGPQGITVEAFGQGGEDTIAGADAESCETIVEVFHGGPEGDVIMGNGRTVIIYGDGNGAVGDWLIDAGDIADSANMSATLFGGDGIDMLESANDLGTIMYGGGHNDVMYGGDGPDEMHGDGGNDSMSGGDGDDVMFGDGGNDIVSGNGGTDLLFGGLDDDTLCGGAGDYDEMSGGYDTDILDDDGLYGESFGDGGTDTCDSITTRTSCESFPTLGYQCGSW